MSPCAQCVRNLQEALKHQETLKPAVDRLAHLEHLAQGFYFKMHSRSKPRLQPEGILKTQIATNPDL